MGDFLMSQHTNPIPLRDEIIDKTWGNLEDHVVCEGCGWQGPLGDLMADADGKDELLKCPICGSPSWLWE
jgi:hypothetical protein